MAQSRFASLSVLALGFLAAHSASAQSGSGCIAHHPNYIEGVIEVTGVQPRNYAGYFSHLIAFDIEEGTLNLSTRFHAAQSGQNVHS